MTSAVCVFSDHPNRHSSRSPESVVSVLRFAAQATSSPNRIGTSGGGRVRAIGHLVAVMLLVGACGHSADEAFSPLASSALVTPSGLPDLVIDINPRQILARTEIFAASQCEVVEGETAAGTRKILRFSFAVANVGDLSVTIGNPVDPNNFYRFEYAHATSTTTTSATSPRMNCSTNRVSWSRSRATVTSV